MEKLHPSSTPEINIATTCACMIQCEFTQAKHNFQKQSKGCHDTENQGFSSDYHMRTKTTDNNKYNTMRTKVSKKKKQQQHKYAWKECEWRWQSLVTTDRREHSRHNYLGRPWHRCWWRTWSWGWDCCHPRCGTWRASPRSGVPGIPRCSDTSTGTESEPHMCRGGTAGWRKACTHTLCLQRSLWSCDPEDTCAGKETAM